MNVVISEGPEPFNPPVDEFTRYETAGHQMPEYAMENAMSTAKVNGNLNKQAAMNFSEVCNRWHNTVKERGLKVAGPKPVAPASIVTNIVETSDAVYVWETAGDPVAECHGG